MQITINEGNNQLDVTLNRITGNLIGSVTDSSTQQPIQGVKVTLDSQVVYTDTYGGFSISSIVPGIYNISFEKDSYDPIQ